MKKILLILLCMTLMVALTGCNVEKNVNWVNKKVFNKMMTKVPKTKKIILSKLVLEDDVKDEEDYIVDKSGDFYKEVKVITDEKEVKEILNILSTAKYAENINHILYGELFQLYDSSDKLIVEFQYNTLNNGKLGVGISFTKSNQDKLSKLFKE